MDGHQPLDLMKARISNMVDLFIENPYHHELIREVAYKNIDTPTYERDIEPLKQSIKTSLKYTQMQVSMGVDEGTVKSLDARMVHIAMIGIAQIFGANPEMVAFMFDNEESVRSLRERYIEFACDLFQNGLKA